MNRADARALIETLEQLLADVASAAEGSEVFLRLDGPGHSHPLSECAAETGALLEFVGERVDELRELQKRLLPRSDWLRFAEVPLSDVVDSREFHSRTRVLLPYRDQPLVRCVLLMAGRGELLQPGFHELRTSIPFLIDKMRSNLEQIPEAEIDPPLSRAAAEFLGEHGKLSQCQRWVLVQLRKAAHCRKALVVLASADGRGPAEGTLRRELPRMVKLGLIEDVSNDGSTIMRGITDLGREVLDVTR